MDSANADSRLKLLEEADIPDWARPEEDEAQSSDDKDGSQAGGDDQQEGSNATSAGRRSRRPRREVIYDETLTEEEFCRLVERGATNVRSMDQPVCPFEHPYSGLRFSASAQSDSRCFQLVFSRVDVKFKCQAFRATG